MAIALYGIDTEPRNLKPQAVLKETGKAINTPSQVLRPRLGIWLSSLALRFTLGSRFFELMMVSLFR